MSNTRVPQVFQELVSRVMRSFYDDKFILVMSLLNKVDWLSDGEISQKLSIPSKELHKLCGKLKEEGFIHIINRQEQKGIAGTRPIPKTYYAVDYGKFINAAKYRMHQIWKRLQDSMDKVKQQRGYMCPECERIVSQLDAISLLDPITGLFTCFRCRVTLITEPENPEKFNAQEKSGRLMQQGKPIFDLLKETEKQEFKVTKETITLAMNKKEMAQRNGTSGELAYSQDTGGNITTIAVTFLENDRASKEEKEAELEKKRQQNAMPIWFLKSTIKTHNKNKISRRKKNRESNILAAPLHTNDEKIRLEKQLAEENERYEFYKKFYYELNQTVAYNNGEDPSEVLPIVSPSRKRHVSQISKSAPEVHDLTQEQTLKKQRV